MFFLPQLATQAFDFERIGRTCSNRRLSMEDGRSDSSNEADAAHKVVPVHLAAWASLLMSLICECLWLLASPYRKIVFDEALNLVSLLDHSSTYALDCKCPTAVQRDLTTHRLNRIEDSDHACSSNWS